MRETLGQRRLGADLGGPARSITEPVPSLCTQLSRRARTALEASDPPLTARELASLFVIVRLSRRCATAIGSRAFTSFTITAHARAPIRACRAKLAHLARARHPPTPLPPSARRNDFTCAPRRLHLRAQRAADVAQPTTQLIALKWKRGGLARRRATRPSPRALRSCSGRAPPRAARHLGARAPRRRKKLRSFGAPATRCQALGARELRASNDPASTARSPA